VSGSTIPTSWRIGEALARHPDLSIVPSTGPDLVIEGDIRCFRQSPDGLLVDERYTLRLEIPPSFPRDLPRVVETAGRIPQTFHRNPDTSLCLGSPIRLLLEVADDPSVIGFIERAIIPYLFGHAYRERVGRMPFGELAHGGPGIEDDVRQIFRLPRATCVRTFLFQAAMKRRHANKLACPCASGLRTGRCHNAALHLARRRLGRARCREQFDLLHGQRRSQRAERAFNPTR